MKEWSATVERLHWRLAIKEKRVYGKLVGDTSRELLPLVDIEIRKKPDAEKAVGELVRSGAAIVAQAKTRMAHAATKQAVASLSSRLRHLRAARDFILAGDVKPQFDDELTEAMRLCVELLEVIDEIPTE